MLKLTENIKMSANALLWADGKSYSRLSASVRSYYSFTAKHVTKIKKASS